MKKSLVLKRFSKNSISTVKLVLFMVIFIIFSGNYAFSEQDNESIEDLRNQINEAFKRAGIFEGYVQYNEQLKMFEVMGKYRTYDEFLYAYMIAQTYAGVKKVSPAYSIKHAIIIHTPIERCLPYVILGRPCPHIKDKGMGETPKIGDIDRELKGQKKVAVVIGISTFKDNRISSIFGADNDALLWGHYLERMGYKVFYFINENATKQRIIDTINAIINNLNDGDTFVLVASSHGTPKNERGEVGIVLYDSGELSQHRCLDHVPTEPHLQAASKMCALVKDSLSIDKDILSKLDRKKITFIPILDACYSGDALRGYLGDVIKPEEVAPLDFYEARLRVNAPKALGLFVASSNGFRISYSAGDVRKIGNVTERMIAVTERGLERLLSRGEETAVQLRDNVVFRPYAHGIFSFFIVNFLEENDHRIVKTVEKTREIINRESRLVCEKESSGKGIRIVRKCPEDGQQPVVLKVNLEEFSFKQ